MKKNQFHFYILIFVALHIANLSVAQVSISGAVYIAEGGTMHVDLPETTFHNGMVTTDRSENYGLLSFGSSAKTIGADHNTHVNGYVRMHAQSGFTFPVGHDAILQPVHIDHMGNSSAVDVAYNHVSHTNLNAEPGIAAVSDEFYWNRGVLDLGQMNLVVDKNATDVFSVNKTNNTITMKADALKEGEKFSSLTTTGTVSHINGATFEIGLKDAGGTHKYIELSNLVSATVTISDGASTTLHTETNVTGTFKYDFTVPASGNAHILVTRENHSNWESDIATDQLTFKANVIQYQTSSSAENQFAMMDLAERILLHSTSINTALTGSSTTVNITTNTTTSTSATEANQEAILTILERVLLKISALRNVF